ncbi:hypothetical protein T439DRAFT_380826 [Meredithblackwellia eburnea MCA 4105]
MWLDSVDSTERGSAWSDHVGLFFGIGALVLFYWLLKDNSPESQAKQAAEAAPAPAVRDPVLATEPLPETPPPAYTPTETKSFPIEKQVEEKKEKKRSSWKVKLGLKKSKSQ